MSTVSWLKSNLPDGDDLAQLPRLISDSRQITPGDIFFAYGNTPIEESDGRHYIQEACLKGARAVVYETGPIYKKNIGWVPFVWDEAWDIPHLGVASLSSQLGVIASEYLNHPSRAFFTLAVTGTNGKTSCTQWLAQAFSWLLDYPCGVVGTLGVGIFKNGVGSEFISTGFTTPDALQLQHILAGQREKGVGTLAIEASSIGLVQGRMNGMHIDVAIFTNLTRDHLDFHHDMQTYAAAKTQLFEWPHLRAAVINLDDALGRQLAQFCVSRGIKVIGYTLDDQGKTLAIDDIWLLRATNIHHLERGIHFCVHTPLTEVVVKTALIGRFNVANLLAVLGGLLARDIAFEAAVATLEKLQPVTGRMEQLYAPGRVLVTIDYAHTPDALEQALSNLQALAKSRGGKLWCVFGCGGDRDHGKRPQMGKVAQLADYIVVTSDNPRSEDPRAIMAHIIAGCDPTRPLPYQEADRAKAILYAIKHASKDDVILLAGKGHEQYQEIKGKKLVFSDKDHANLALMSLASKGVGI